MPTEPVAFVRPARAAAVLGVNGDADPGRLNGIFSPPPLVFGLGRGEAAEATGIGAAGWLALSVREAVDSLTCAGVRYEPLDGGFRLRLPYEGHTRVAGEWTSPSLVLVPVDRSLDAIDAHRDDLIAHGFAPTASPEQHDWWTEPMFCGWGAQCARSMRHLHGYDGSEGEQVDGLPADPAADLAGEPEPHGDEEELVVLLAPQYARQDVYDEFLAELAAAELDPGTIVVDDRWQHEYGTAEPDTSHWPDLRRWIADRHAEGRKVLLWWKAWDPEGLPVEECVTDPFGRAVAVDPGSEAYLARLEEIVERLLGADGLNADGFKVDFTQRTPSGRGLRHSGGTWGIASLHRLLAAIHAAAHAVKPDALVITHAIHPSFGDVGDMVRLNDVLERDVRDQPVPVAEQLRMRHAIARRALPGHTVDTDQWPMPDRAEWLSYVETQAELGVPALYYLEAMDRTPEAIGSDDLRRVAESWQRYRERRAAESAALRVTTPTIPAIEVEEVTSGIFLVRDTCNVYVIASDEPGPEGERTAIAVDFGSGAVLDLLAGMGIDRLTHVLMTHHHRDQGQGLPRAVSQGVPVLVPPVEIELFARVDEMWTGRPLDNDYNLRQDRFSLLDPIPVAGTVREYRTDSYGGVEVLTLPTPGHTIGSVSYIVERGGRRIGLTGDLIHSPGKVWSLAASQWSYSHHEGPAMVVLTSLLMAERGLDLVLPSHGDPFADCEAAFRLLADRMQYLVDSRRWHPWDLAERLRSPFVPITEHLLFNVSAMSYSYVLLSRTGEALVIDYGYDMTTGMPTGTDRAARRPWLESLPALRRDHGVTRISVALPTHYHDDHVAGMPLLREVEGTEIWSPANVAPILADPLRHDLPCLWFDPIESDRVLPLGEPFRWNEYTITPHDQPGHTLYAVAYELEVDGVRVLFTGDQQEGLGIPDERNEILNYQYRNRFRIDDYRKSAALYRRIAPGLLAGGHWQPRWVEDGYLDYLGYAGDDLVEIHEALLPLDRLDLGADGQLARLTPYRSRVAPGAEVTLEVRVRNPHATAATAWVTPVVPEGWRVVSSPPPLDLEPGGEAGASLTFAVQSRPERRTRVAVDIVIGSLRLGQHAEALLDVGEEA